jgi:hypothetical protein
VVGVLTFTNLKPSVLHQLEQAAPGEDLDVTEVLALQHPDIGDVGVQRESIPFAGNVAMKHASVTQDSMCLRERRLYRWEMLQEVEQEHRFERIVSIR